MTKKKYPYRHRRDPFVVWEKKMAEARADATLKASVHRVINVAKAIEECVAPRLKESIFQKDKSARHRCIIRTRNFQIVKAPQYRTPGRRRLGRFRLHSVQSMLTACVHSR